MCSVCCAQMTARPLPGAPRGNFPQWLAQIPAVLVTLDANERTSEIRQVHGCDCCTATRRREADLI